MGTYLDLAKLHLYTKTGQQVFVPNITHPLRASLRLTERCNSRCITCDYWKKPYEDEITSEKAVNIIRQLYNLGVKRLRFTGGETLLRSDFFDILHRIEGLGFKKVTLATNGLLLEKYHREINASCLTDLGVSLDGLAESNDKIRGIKGGFERVIRSLELINDKRTTIMSTVTSLIADDLDRFFGLISRKGLLWDMNLPENHLYFLQDASLGGLWPSEEQVDKIVKIIQKYRDEPFLKRISDVQIEYARKYLKGQELDEPPCVLGFTDVGIDSSGNLYSGCYAMPAIGNVLNEDLIAIMASDRYRRRQKDMLERKCPGCNCGYELNLIIQELPKRTVKYLCGSGVK